MAARPIKIDVVSDTVCPWCFIGKKRLETAMKQFKGMADFEVRWRPFQLNPSAPVEGQNKLQMYEAKFGQDRVAAMKPMMEENFRKEGLPPISFGGMTGNTFDSHRLIWKAAQVSPQAQDSVVDELMRNYFCEEKFINDKDVLVAAAKKAGIQDADKFLTSEEGKEEVKHELVAFAHKFRVSGVPFFVINDGQYTLSGAQPPEQFASVFSRVLAA